MAATEAGKAVSAQNAVTHGLTARHVVLTAHGEDPDDYDALRREISESLQPGNPLERQYVETIAAATWRLGRFRRWQNCLYEDGDLTEGERLAQIERALRHETALHRQIDRALRALTRTLPELLATRASAETAPAPAEPQSPLPPRPSPPSQGDESPTSVERTPPQICKNEPPETPSPLRIRASDLWDVQTRLPGDGPHPLGGSLAQQARRLALTTGRAKNDKTNSIRSASRAGG